MMDTQALTINKSGDEVQILCNGEFTTQHAGAIKETLLAEMNGTEAIVLSLQYATAFDVAGIQLAFAWKKKMEALGRTVRVSLPETETIKDLLAKAGITKLF
jgi:anti-anti-sigma regulatory factor